MPSPRSVPRRLAYALLATAAFLGVATAGVAGLERAGWLDSFRQDDTVLYLTGQYLRPSADGARYEIRDAQAPTLVQASFAARKARGTFRVFVTGESFVRGGHHIPPGTAPVGYGTITDWTLQLLEARYPSVRFEVVNAGANGQGSLRIAQVVEELVHADPDLVVVAVGNNEGVVPVTGVSEELNEWILYRALKKAVLPEPAREERPAWQLQTLSPGAIGASFERNVRRMIAAADAAGVRLALATLPQNLTDIATTTGPPEAARAQADPACREATARAARGECDAAMEAGARCDQQFWVATRTAECLRAQGRTAEARDLYKVAVQLEPRGRARPSYNETLRALAAEHDLLLVDLERGMEARSPGGLPGGPPFIDAVHLTCMGYLGVARDLVDAIVAAGLVDAGFGEPRPAPTTAELLAEGGWDPVQPGMTPPMAERARRVCGPDPGAP